MASKVIDDALKSIQQMRDGLRTIAESSPDVKEGKCTVEDELQEPGYVLYSEIINVVASYFENPAVQQLCETIGDRIGNDATSDIISLLSVAMAHASYNSILAYDAKLKAELSEQFQPIIDSCNKNSGDIQTFNSALQIFRVQLGELTGKDKLDKMVKDQNASTSKDQT